MKKILSLLVVIVMLLGLCACGPEDIPTYENFIKTVKRESLEEEATAQTVKIGVLEPLTGQYDTYAQDEIDGIEMARKLFPKVLGNTVELIYADNQSDTTTCVEAAQSLIDQGCMAIIGSYGNMLSLSVCDLMDESKVAMIVPSCTNPLLTTTTNYLFRVCVVEAFEGNSAAKYVIDYLPGVLNNEAIAQAIETGTDDMSAEVNSEAEEETEELSTQAAILANRVNCYILKNASDEKASVQIERFQDLMESVYGNAGYVKVIEYPDGTEDMTTYFERLKKLDAQAVFFPSTASEGERILYDAYSNGYNFRWIGNSDWSGLMDSATEAQRENIDHLNGAAYVAAFDNDADAITTMTMTYNNAVAVYFKDEAPGENVALGFDAYLIALEGVRQAGLDANTAQVRKAISKIQDLEVATGTISYWGGNGDPVKDVVIEKIVNGEVIADYVAAPTISEEELDDEI